MANYILFTGPSLMGSRNFKNPGPATQAFERVVLTGRAELHRQDKGGGPLKLLRTSAYAGLQTGAEWWPDVQPARPTDLEMVVDDRGEFVDAHYAVETIGNFDTVYLASRGGTIGQPGAQNTEYGLGLRLILERALVRGWLLDRAEVQSRTTVGLRSPQRRIQLDGLNYPIGAESLVDAEELRRAIQRGASRVGKLPGASRKGNGTKAIRL